MSEQNDDVQIGMDWRKFMVHPHDKVARDVTDADVERIIKTKGPTEPSLMVILMALCHTPMGRWATGHAMAHSQIDAEDPMNFFVTKYGQAVINPVMVNHTKVPMFQEEGCLTFCEEKITHVMRYNLVEVQYQTITEDGKLSESMFYQAKGMEAQIYQHEMDHLKGKYIYPYERPEPPSAFISTDEPSKGFTFPWERRVHDEGNTQQGNGDEGNAGTI